MRSTAWDWTARWKRLRALKVAAMASGETRPDSKTLPPRGVISRSSWRDLSWWATTRAILSRQELEPISMAANVGMEEMALIGKIHEEGRRARDEGIGNRDQGPGDSAQGFSGAGPCGCGREGR